MASKDSPQRTGGEYIRMLYTYAESCNHALSDMDAAEDSGVFYNIDLSSVFSYIFGASPSREVPKFKKSGKAFANQLLQTKGTDIGFTPFFTIFGILELVDQYLHHAKALRKDIELGIDHQKLIEKVARMDFFSFERYISTSKFAESIIRRFNYVLSGNDFAVYHRRALALIGQSGPISGVGDILHKNFKIDRKYQFMFNDLFNEMRKRRIDSNRSPKDRDFHFLMDCGNMVLCTALQDHLGSHVNFVTDQAHRKYITDIYRNPVGVSLWCSAHMMERNGLAASARDVIEDIGITAQRLYSRLKTKHNFAESQSAEEFILSLDPYTATELKHFTTHKIMPTNIKNPNDIRDLWIEVSENLTRSGSSEHGFSARAEEKIHSIDENAKDLVTLIPEMMDRDLIMDFGINQDEVVKEIFSKYR